MDAEIEDLIDEIFLAVTDLSTPIPVELLETPHATETSK